ncbi:MAG: hypothetical protein R2819_14050 [Allomuricauda sp.]
MFRLKVLFVAICLPIFFHGIAQSEIKIHSHNDYQQPIPFWGAFAAGAQSIEADILFKDGVLYVAHEDESIVSGYTLEPMYLLPLERVKKLYGDRRLEFQLMLDIKTEPYATLEAIMALLDQYINYLKPYNRTGVTVVISGNRPLESDYDRYPGYIKFDCQDMVAMPRDQWEKVAMISTNFKNLSGWDGLDVPTDLDKVAQFIAEAKKHSKPVRLWATPDTEMAWKTLMELGVDFINTDHPYLVKTYIESIPATEKQ